MTMPSRAAAAGVEHRIRMPAATGELADGELQDRKSSAAKLERRLNRFVRFVALGEWAGNACGALAFLWATGVLLGGFCTSLKPEDFWYATVMIFLEAFRIFSRGYRLDNQSLFGTTKALKWISSSFIRVLQRPQEGDEVVLIMGLWINLLDQLPLHNVENAIEVALLILLSRWPRRPGRLQIWALLIAYLAIVARTLWAFISIRMSETSFQSWPDATLIDATLIADTIQTVAVLLLVLRPRGMAVMVSVTCSRILLSLVKVISVLGLVSGLVLNMFNLDTPAEIEYVIVTSFASVVLSLSSLQTPGTCDLLGPWIDAVHRICFLWVQAFPLPDYLFYFLRPHPSMPATSGMSFIIFLVLLLVGNLQIPVAIVQVGLSLLRFHQLLSLDDYSPLLEGSSINMVPAIKVFFVLALCQGSLYIMSSILGVFSFFPRRSLVRQSKFCGQLGAEAIDLYYKSAYATCMDTGLLTAKKTVSLASFAVESLHSSSDKMQLAGVVLLDRLLPEEEELMSRIINSNRALSTLIGMLRWADVRDRDTRLFAARVTVKLADSIRIAEIPGLLKSVSSLFDAEIGQQVRQHDSLQNRGQVSGLENVAANLTPGQECSAQTASEENAVSSQPKDGQLVHGEGYNNTWCTWVRQYWQQTKERWSIEEEPPPTHQDAIPVVAMTILEKLACDLDNCAEMLKDEVIISKIIGLIRHNDAVDNYEHQNAVICSSLNVLRRLAATGENIGIALRQKLWKSSFLLNNLIDILEDGRGSPEVWEPTMDIIGKLALNKRAGHEIGRIQVIVARLLHAFLGRQGPTVRMTAGEALANIATWGTANCLAILAEPGYEVIKDLSDLLSEDNYRNVAATLLQNICEHCRDKLHHHGASEHLSSALPVVMENIIMSASGKQLESLVSLASQMCDVIPSIFARELDSHVNAEVLIQNIVCTLNSNKKPNPEYPRMRRVIIEIAISILKSCPRYASIFKEEGMMEALTAVERTPSKVENYRVFYGNVGVVLASGTSLRVLAAKAKGLIDSAALVPGSQQEGHA